MRVSSPRLLRALYMRNLICVLPFIDICGCEPNQRRFPRPRGACGAAGVVQKRHILTGDGRRLDETDLYIAEGQIQWVSEGEMALGATKSMPVVSGLHRPHRCALTSWRLPSPGVAAHSDGNGDCTGHRRGVGRTQRVATRPWIFESGWRCNGYANSPGSANLFGAAAWASQNVPSVSYQGMKFPTRPTA